MKFVIRRPDHPWEYAVKNAPGWTRDLAKAAVYDQEGVARLMRAGVILERFGERAVTLEQAELEA